MSMTSDVQNDEKLSAMQHIMEVAASSSGTNVDSSIAREGDRDVITFDFSGQQALAVTRQLVVYLTGSNLKEALVASNHVDRLGNHIRIKMDAGKLRSMPMDDFRLAAEQAGSLHNNGFAADHAIDHTVFGRAF